MTKLAVSPYIIRYRGHVYHDDKIFLLMAYAQGERTKKFTLILGDVNGTFLRIFGSILFI